MAGFMKNAMSYLGMSDVVDDEDDYIEEDEEQKPASKSAFDSDHTVTPRHHVIFAVHDTQRLITGCHVVNNNAKSHNVRQLLKRSVFLLHFAPNRIRRFFPAGNRGLNAVFRHIFFQLADYFRHQIAALFTQKIQPCYNRIVSLFVQLGKCDFFQLGFNLLHTDTFGQRSINIQRFLSYPFTLFFRTEM